jgi:hypothetical protein
MNDTFMRVLPGNDSSVEIEPFSMVKAETFASDDRTELDQSYFTSDIRMC